MAGLPGIPIRLRRDTEAEWAADNPVLKLGETGWTTDTLRVKLGDGVTAWNDLDYAIDPDSPVGEVDSVAGVLPVAGDVPEAGLKTALDLPADTVAELANRATDAELAAEAVLARNADNLTSGTVAEPRIAAAIARLASPAFTGAPTAPTQSAGDNSTKIATTAYADALIAAADAMVFKGVIDASGNPNYPAADKGWTYRISVAGKIGGASGVNVEVGDLLLCLVDGSPAGTQAAVGANWSIAQTNIDGAVIGPASAVDNRVALFDGATGKLIKDSGVLFSALAQLASPALTGNPTAPTPTSGDNDTSVATSAFALPRPTVTAIKTANYTAAAGEFVRVDSTSGSISVTFPTAPADNTVVWVHRTAGGNGVSVARGGADVISPAAATSVFIGPNSSAATDTSGYIYNAAAATWYPLGSNSGDNVRRQQFTAKGDIAAASAASTVTRLAVGANGGQLVGDSGQTTGLRWTTALRLEGSGSPEGSVTAPVGSIYTDSASTLGRVEWTKVSGAGNTGWSLPGGYNWTPSFDLVSGRYYFAGETSTISTSAVMGNGTFRATPFVVSKTTSIARLFAEFTVAGDAASVLRLGIYADSGAGYPGALILDAGSISTGSGNAGTVATGGTPGVYEITVSQSLAPGLYWFGAVVQGVTVTQPTIRINTGNSRLLPIASGTTLPGASAQIVGYGMGGVTGALPGTFTVGQNGTFGAPRIGFRVT